MPLDNLGLAENIGSPPKDCKQFSSAQALDLHHWW